MMYPGEALLSQPVRYVLSGLRWYRQGRVAIGQMELFSTAAAVAWASLPRLASLYDDVASQLEEGQRSLLYHLPFPLRAITSVQRHASTSHPPLGYFVKVLGM